MSLYIIFSMNKSEYLNPTYVRYLKIYQLCKSWGFNFYKCSLRVYFNDAELHFPFPRWLEDNALLIRGWSVAIK